MCLNSLNLTAQDYKVKPWWETSSLGCGRISIDAINIDFVIVVVESNERLEIRHYPTGVPHKVLEKLEKVMMDETCSLFEMQDEVAPYLPEDSPLFIDYLAPNEYSSSYVFKAQYPTKMSGEIYAKHLQDIEMKAEENLRKQLVVKYPKDENAQEKEFESAVIDTRVRARRNRMNSLKRQYYYIAQQYLYALHYINTLQLNCVDCRLGKDVKMYSTDTVGFSHFTYNISEDLKIKVHTNFGYGASSFFRVELTYKGIPILPYSYYVTYFYANSRDLARFTRIYKVERRSWLLAFKFVVDTANLSASNPDQFVKEWVMAEVETMVQGLKRIVEDPSSCIDKWLSVKYVGDDENPYLTVRKMDSKAIEEYKCYPNEMSIEFKASKVSGALDFLQSLKALRCIYNDVDKAVKKIKDLGYVILPEIRSAIRKIEIHVEKLQKEHAVLTSAKRKFEAKIRTYEEEYRTIKEEKSIQVQMDWSQDRRVQYEIELREEYESTHPDFVRCNNDRVRILEKLNKLEIDIRRRNGFKEGLGMCMRRIAGYGLDSYSHKLFNKYTNAYLGEP